ncbi:MAG: PqiC family protein [Caldimonas sp.]
MHRLPSSRTPSSVRSLAGVLVVMFALVAASCTSVTPVHVHTLMPAEIAAPGQAAAQSGRAPLTIVLSPIRLPAQVDRPQWLVRLPDDSLAVLEQDRWASPLRDELREAVLEELAVKYGVSEARGAAPGAAPPWRVSIDVRRFDSLPGREARSEGSWLIRGADARTQVARCDWLIREPAPGTLDALAAAHRRAVLRLADAIGAALVRLDRGEAASCPHTDSPA